jgi:hypothetical protein
MSEMFILPPGQNDIAVICVLVYSGTVLTVCCFYNIYRPLDQNESASKLDTLVSCHTATGSLSKSVGSMVRRHKILNINDTEPKYLQPLSHNTYWIECVSN